MVTLDEYEVIEDKNKSYNGYILAFFGAFVLSFDTLLIKLSYDDLNTWIILFYRYIFYFLGSFIFVLCTEKCNIKNITNNIGKYDLLAILTLSTCNICFTKAVLLISITNTLAMYATSPILTSILNYFILKERLYWWTILVLIIVTGTILYIVIDDMMKETADENSTLGYILALLATISTSLYFTIIKYIKVKIPDKNILRIIPSSALLTVVFSLIFILANKLSFTLSNKSLSYLSIQGIVVLTISFLSLTYSTNYISSSESNLMILLETILAPIWLNIFHIENITTSTIIGLSIVVTFLFLNSLITIFYEKKVKDDHITNSNVSTC